MTAVIVEGDADGSFQPTLAAILRDLADAPGDTVMGLYHYGDALEATPLNTLGTAIEQEYRAAAEHRNGVATFGRALTAAAARIRSGDDLIPLDFLWGIAMSLRLRSGAQRRVRLIAVGLDGTVHWGTVQPGLPLACTTIPNGTNLLGIEPVVAGLDTVLEAAVRERDRSCRSAITAMLADLRNGEGDSHAAFGIWQRDGGIVVEPLLEATDAVDRHLVVLRDVDAAIERAAADLTATPPHWDATGLIGTGLIGVDRTGPLHMITTNTVVGTRLHLVAWPFEHDAPTEDTRLWHEVARTNRRFVAALRALTAALRGPAA
jgi:hypothetical protein